MVNRGGICTVVVVSWNSWNFRQRRGDGGVINRGNGQDARTVMAITRRAKTENAGQAMNSQVSAIVHPRHHDLNAANENNTGGASGHAEVT